MRWGILDSPITRQSESVETSRAMEEVRRLKALGPSDSQLVSAVWDEDREGVPSKRCDQVLVHSLAYQSFFQPSQASVTCTRTGYHTLEVLAQGWDQVVHVLETFQR